MASLLTSSVLSGPNIANAAIKASTQSTSLQPGSGDSDFAAMLNSAAPAEKPQAAPKTAATDKPIDKPADKTDSKAESKTDGNAGNKSDPAAAQATTKPAKADAKTAAKNKTDVKGQTDAKDKTDKTAGKTDEKKNADKTDGTGIASAETAKPAPPPQSAGATDDSDSDPAGDNMQTAANPTNHPQQAGAQQQAAAQQPAPDPAPQLPAPQAAQAPDAAAQAQQISQQMMAAAAPAAQAHAAPTLTPTSTSNDNNAVSGTASAGKSARPPAPRASANLNVHLNANPGAASQPGQSAGQTPDQSASAAGDTPAVKAAPGTVPDFLKAVGHADAKGQTDTPTAAVQTADATQPAAQPAPTQAAPVPATNTAAIAAGITPATGVTGQTGIAPNGASAAGVAVNTHVAPQGPTPNLNGMAVEIAARSQSGAKEFQIRLDPPELGHVEVRLSIDASGKAEAHMTADQQQTLDLLQKNSPTLTSALRDAGLDVSQSGLNFSLKGQNQQSGDSNSGAQMRGPSVALAATKTIDAAQSANPYLSSAGDARLDIHV